MEKTDYKGIDYGNGKTNIDKKTGIRYGVISQNEVLQVWAEESEAHYGEPACPYCGVELEEHWDEEDTICPECQTVIDPDRDFDIQEPLSFYYDRDGYQAEQSADDTDIFIFKSPYYTYAQFCSPCAPGAGYLMNPLKEKDENNRAYCFGHDWFEEEKAPYPVFSVKTGEEILNG